MSDKNDDKDDNWVENADGSWTNTATGETWGSKDGGDAKDDSDGKESSSSGKDGAASGKDESKDVYECTADSLGSYPASYHCLTHDGANRCWYEYVSSPAPTTPAPIFLDMHGHGGCGTFEAAVSGWREIADEYGGLVIWPVGAPDATGSNAWGGMGEDSDSTDKHPVDDVGFLRALVADATSRHAAIIDPTRLFAVGYSNGCMMAQRFALEASDIVTAVGCQSGHLLGAPSNPPAGFRTTPAVLVHGTEDSIVAYGTQSAVAWAGYNGCSDAAPTVTRYTGGNGDVVLVQHLYHVGCDSGVEVALLELPSVGHSSFSNSVPGGSSQRVWASLSRYSRDESSGAIVVGDTLSVSPPLGVQGSNAGVIAGGVAGGVAVLLSLGLLYRWMRRPSTSPKTNRSTEMTTTALPGAA